MSSKTERDFSSRAKAMSSYILVSMSYRTWAQGKLEGQEWSMLNPKRGDKDYGSFKLNLSKGVWEDFATGDKGGDLVDLFAYLNNITHVEALSQLEERYGRRDNLIDLKSRTSSKLENNSACEQSDDWNVAPAPCNDLRDSQGKLPTLVANYYNKDGELIGHVARYEGKKPGSKDYKPWTYVDGKWKCSKAGWKKTPIFGVEKLLGNDNPVLIVEGEKCAIAAQSVLGDSWNVLAWPGGVNQAATPDWSILSDVPKVFLWPDDDLDKKSLGFGVKAMNEIAVAVGPHAIVLDPHPHNAMGISGWDVADAIEEGWDKSRLEEFILSHSPVEALPPEQQGPAFEFPEEIAEICKWILKVANEKHETFAIEAAFVLLASLTMGAYETPTFGSVGIYSLLISGAGGGKAAYVEKIMQIARQIAPFALAGEPGSRQALRSDLSVRKSNCLTIYNGELGVGLARVLVENGIGAQISQDLLDLWGGVNFLEGLSTKDSKDPDVYNPRLSLYGGTTMGTFQDLLSRKGAVSGGFLSRLDPIISTKIDLEDESSECNDPLPEYELQRLKRIAHAMTSQSRSISNMDTTEGLTAVRVNKQKTVAFTLGAEKLYKEYKLFCRKRRAAYAEKNNLLMSDLYSRCYEKSGRYSSLLAIAANPDAPEITQKQYEWARDWVENFTHNMCGVACVFGHHSAHEKIRAAILQYLLKEKAHAATMRDLRRETCLRSEDVNVVKSVSASMVEDGLIEHKVSGKSLILSLTKEGIKHAKR